ncbi:hypothetical protein D3C76_1304740 [compost metagenome]
MSSIRDEIVESQKLFEDHSILVSKVLNLIQVLYFYRKGKEAAEFQRRIEEIWESNELSRLYGLADEVEKAVIKAREAFKTKPDGEQGS